MLPHVRGSIITNCFPLFAPSVIKDRTIEKWFFIDQTLLQLFDYYEQRPLIGRRIAEDAIEREREGYCAATGIIVHSHWAAESVIRDYGVPTQRVHVVVPGANIDPVEYARWEAEEEERRTDTEETDERPLRLVFVGKYWQRKGLDRLLRALAVARCSGLSATLRVIGCQRETVPSDLRNVDGVEWIGFLDKQADAARFLRTVAECDVGCLLSRAEAGGIALREYHALGLVVLGTDAGGAPEHMISNASLIVPTQAAEEEIATTLLDLEKDLPRFARLRAIAWQRRHSALWEETVRQIKTIWPSEVAAQCI